MDDAQILRNLTGVRRLVLDVVAAEGPVMPGRISAAWAAARPDMTPRLRSALPRMVSQILWRLENLEWITPGLDGYRITTLGDRARKVTTSVH